MNARIGMVVISAGRFVSKDEARSKQRAPADEAASLHFWAVLAYVAVFGTCLLIDRPAR